jgi:hypothetical protein
MYTGPHHEAPDEHDAEGARYERERGERAARRNQISWKIIGWVMAAALALLTYDAAGAAVEARRTERPWLYPAAISLTCALGLTGLLALAARALRRRARESEDLLPERTRDGD